MSYQPLRQRRLNIAWRWLAMAGLCLLTLVVASVSATANADQSDNLAKIEPLILDELAAGGTTDYFIWMAEKADLSPAANLRTKLEKGTFVFNALRETADRSQSDLRAFLDAAGADYESFYIANKIFVRGGNQELLLEVAARPDVDQVTANHQFQLQEPFIDEDPPKVEFVIEPNITFVNADDVWALGYTGVGTVMAGNDTGLDWDHPALINQYRGWNGSTADHNYNWWDATGAYPLVPDDGHGHGTHTTGTMVGDDGGSNQIGLAPGAQTIHCKNMTDGGSGSDLTFTTCFEWDLAPWDLTGANPNPAMAPHAINNSWGYFGGNQPQFEDEIAALIAAGVVVEVSAGNEGAGCATLRSPGDYMQSLTTGSVNHFGGSLPGTITGFSSRGPSALYPADFQPDVMAPGENINSSLPGGGYSGPTWSGTSMSGPHVTALVALMWEASPAIEGDVAVTIDIIQDTAVRLVGQMGSNCGGDYTVGPNNDWGFGTMDALAAVNEAILRGGPGYQVFATPPLVSVCTPDDAVYDVELTQILGFDSPVTLTSIGHPAGTTATFVPNPLTPPGNSAFTIGNTGAAAAGDYSIAVVGSTITKTQTSTVGLSVYTALPGGVSLSLPADGAINVVLAPTLSWTGASQAGTYDVQVATDSGFGSIVYTATVDSTSHTLTSSLDPLTLYYWRVRANNACGDGAFSTPFSFTTRDVPPILLVDDDDNSPDVRAYYTNALDGLGALYDIWDTGNSDDEPTAAELTPYTTVIWFTGLEFGGFAGPGAAGEAALGAWLEDGNCMFISSQDYYWDRGLTAFMDNYLGVANATSDIGQTSVTGAGSVFSGLGPYSLSYPFTNYSDIVNPDGNAELAFSGNMGNAAVNKDSGVYRTTFWGFPFEAVPNLSDRIELAETVLDWCGAGVEAGTLAGQVTDADSGLGISGAQVLATDGSSSRTVSTDGNGDYEMNLAVGTYDVTASATNYLSVTVTGVVIVTNTTTTQDFVLQGSSLTFSPGYTEESMEIGDVVTNTVTVTNSGPLAIDFSVSIGGYGGPTAAPISIPASDGNFLRGTAPFSSDVAPRDLANDGAPDGADSGGPLLQVPLGSLAYALEVEFVGFIFQTSSFDTDTPQTMTPIAPNNNHLPGADFLNGDFSTLYALNYDTNQFITIDTATGAITPIGPAFPVGGEQWTGMAGDPTSGDLYATSCSGAASTLYTIDPATGAPTVIGSAGSSPCTIAIAIDGSGDMYGLDVVTDALYSIDKSSGAATMIGPVGFSPGFSQGMDFDEATGILYLAAYDDVLGQGQLRVADTTTGNSVLVGLFGGDGNREVTTMAVASGAGSQWASAVPDSGTVPPYSSSTFDVVFDATSLIQVGDYTAELSFSGTFVNEPPVMPLTMHLSCPTCGFLDGSIFDDTTGDPLSAAIHVTSTNGFDVTVNGDSYALAVQPGTYHFNVSASGYLPDSATVVATQGVTTTTDFYLIPDVAILEYAPPAIEEDMEIGQMVSNTVTVTNSGAHELEYSVSIGNSAGPGAFNPVAAINGPVGAFSVAAPIGPLSVRSAEGSAYLKELQESDPLAWTTGTSLPPGDGIVRYAHAQCADDPDSFYAISGVNEAASVTNKAWRYDADTDTWNPLAPIPMGQEGPAAVCVNGFIYVLGGGGTTQFFIYDVAGNSWAPGPALPRAVWGPAIGSYNGFIYMAGGDNDFFFGGTSAVVNVYDIAGGVWSGTGASMPTPAVTAGEAQAGQYLYVVGGWGDSSPGSNVNATQRYDMDADAWEIGPTFTSARADFPMAATQNNLYAIGGDNNGGGAFDATNLVEALDYNAWPGGSWTDVGDPLPQGLTAHGGGFCTEVVTGGEVWSVGGLTSGFIFVGTTQYRPAEGCLSGGPEWAYAVPDSGTIPPNSSATFDVVFDATSLIQVGDYTAELSFSGTFVNEPPVMPLTMHLSCPTCGFLDGSIFDDTTGDPLSAAIHVTSTNGFDVTVNGDSYALAVQPGTYHFDVSASGYLPDSATVVATQGVTTTTNFSLIPDVAILEYAPLAIEEDMEIGQVVSNTVTVTNSGAHELEYSVSIGGYGGPTAAPISIPASDGNFLRGTAPFSSDVALRDLANDGALDGADSGGPLLQVPLGSLAYALEVEFVGFIFQTSSFDTDTPQTMTPIAPNNNHLPGADFLNGDFSTLYALNYDTNQFIAIDTATGAITPIGPAFPVGGEQWTGMAGDPTSGDLYATSCSGAASTLYTIDPATGAPTVIGSAGSSPCTIAIAIDGSGDMYGLDVVTDALYSIDKSSGAATMIGPVGFSPGFSQGMDFDEATGILYLAAYDDVLGQGQLRVADTTTGNSVLVGLFGGDGNREVTTMAVASGAGSQWASAVPDSGTVPPYSSSTFEVVFDARSLYQVGTYTARLSFSGNFVNEPPTMPLTMNVNCPTCGFLEGEITDALSGDPLSADINITGPNSFDVTLSGDSYSLAVQPGTYDFTVTANGYMDATASVTVAQGATVVTDFALTPIIAVLEYSPQLIEVTIAQGDTASETLTIENTGTVPFDFSLVDIETGRPTALEAASVTCPPDAFGYTCIDSNEAGGPAYDFEDISGSGTPIFLADDQMSGPVPLGFTFAYYGSDYTEVYVSSNGFLTVLPGQYNGCCTGSGMPTPGDPDGVIAAWWEDLNPAVGGAIHYQMLGAAPTRRLIVQFTDVPHFGGGNPVTMQFKLFENSNNIEVHYSAAPSDGGTHSAGIENQSGTVGLQYYLGSSALPTPLAVCYRYANQPSCGSGGSDATWVTEDPDAGTVNAGEALDVSILFDTATITQTGTYTALLYFSGTYDNDVTPATLVMHVTKEQPSVDVGANQAANGYVGTTVDYVFAVTNDGNVTSDYDILLSGHTWTTSSSHTTTGPIAPGDSVNVTITVHVPAGASHHATDTVTVMARAVSDASVSDTATATTTAQWYGLLMPAIFKP